MRYTIEIPCNVAINMQDGGPGSEWTTSTLRIEVTASSPEDARRKLGTALSAVVRQAKKDKLV